MGTKKSIYLGGHPRSLRLPISLTMSSLVGEKERNEEKQYR